MKTLLFLLFSLLTNSIYGQLKFPVAYKDCIKEEYIFEEEKQLVFIEDSNFIKSLRYNFLKELNAEGLLVLVIGVNTEGRSCLFSADNNTNISNEDFNLKNNIDRYLVWEKPINKTIAIIVLAFKENKVFIKRLGKNKAIFYESEYKLE